MKRFIIWTQAKRLFYLFSEALKELILSYNFECITVYKFVNLQRFELREDDIIIIIGIQFFKLVPELNNFLKNYRKIVYSTEPLCCKNRLKDTVNYFENIHDKNTIIWEYSKYNIEYLKRYDIKNYFIPFGYYKMYENRIKKNKKKIDFLFYGDLTKRRLFIKNELIKKGYSVLFSNKLYDPNKRDDKISRSRIVLDIFRTNNFECNNLYRLSYLLANKVFIISEKNNCIIYKNLTKIIFVDYNELISTCEKYISLEESERDKIANNAYHEFLLTFDVNNIINNNLLIS